jgi:lipopolysaccharide transport system permease protein
VTKAPAESGRMDPKPTSPGYEGVPAGASPVLTISPEYHARLNLAELWQFRELLWFLTWRDIKVRYKQTLLGVAWAILQPALTTLVFAVFFGRLAAFPSDGIPYPLFAVSGLLPWLFFANAISTGGTSLVRSSNLVSKVYFPRMIVPAAAVLAGVVDLAVGSVVLFALQAYYRVLPGWNLLLLPLFVAAVILFSFAVGIALAAFDVRYRDFRYLMPFVVQLWMFLSPVIYPVSLVPEKWRWVVWLNPMTGLLQGWRASLFGTGLTGLAMAESLGAVLVLTILAMYLFRWMEPTFADVI